MIKSITIMSLFQFTLRIFLLKHIFATHSNSLVFFFKEETKVPCEKGQIEKSNYFYNFFMSAYINLPHSFFFKKAHGILLLFKK